jgi:hypothetical protein
MADEKPPKSPKPLSAPDPNAELQAPLTMLVCLVPFGVAGELLRWAGRGMGSSDLLADQLMRQLGWMSGLTLPVLPLIILVTVGLLAHFIGRYRWKPPSLGALGRIALWTVIWSLIRVLVGMAGHHLAPDQIAGPAGLAMCGALQEELIFRGLSLGCLIMAGVALKLPKAVVITVALVLSAVFFSLAHTTVVNHFPGAEPFAWPAFAERTAAGLLYGIVFLRQGLAVCTFSHAAYNLLLVFGPAALLR